MNDRANKLCDPMSENQARMRVGSSRGQLRNCHTNANVTPTERIATLAAVTA